MSAVAHVINGRIARIAWELVDHEHCGWDKPDALDLMEERVWEAWERCPRLLDRLERVFGLSDIAKHIADVRSGWNPTASQLDMLRPGFNLAAEIAHAVS